MNDHVIQIGKTFTYGGDADFGLRVEDARQHTYLIGKTGSGKTTLLRNLILQHIAAGHGVALLDPHGDLADELLDHFPPSRADDLIYFNPADTDFPIGFNPLAQVPPAQRPLVAAGLTSAFKSIWRDSWGPRMEYILHHALAALLECPNTSLLGVNRMLADERYRKWVVGQVRDPFIRAFWTDEFAKYEPRFMREVIAPIQNKLGQLMLNPAIRNILGQVRSRIDLRYMMDSGRVFIANLAKGRLGADQANLLGALLTAQFQHAAMTRADTPEEERRDFFLLIDEFQNFTTDSFASILAEARKYRLSLTLSHQYIDQLLPPIRQAVFGNVGTLISFRIGHTDAAVMAAEFGQAFPAARFADLGRFEVLVRVLEYGTTREPFQGKTHPPLHLGRGRRHRLITCSRQNFPVRSARWKTGCAVGSPIRATINRCLDCQDSAVRRKRPPCG